MDRVVRDHYNAIHLLSWMHKKLDESTGDSGLNHGIDAFIRSIAEVGNRPAGVRQNLRVLHKKVLAQGRQC